MIASELRAIRLKLGLTQKEMAPKIHRSRAQYVRYESGISPINGAIAEIAEGLARQHGNAGA